MRINKSRVTPKCRQWKTKLRVQYQCRGSIIHSAKTCQLKTLPNIRQSNLGAYAKPTADKTQHSFKFPNMRISETEPFLLDDPLLSIWLYLGCQDNIFSWTISLFYGPHILSGKEVNNKIKNKSRIKKKGNITSK